jgi:hypothetical protein
VDQTWVFDDKYWIVAFGLLLLCALLAVESARRDGARRWFGSDLFQVSALTAAGVFLLPNWIWLPGYLRQLNLIPERMSLAIGVMVVALAALATPRRWHDWAMGGLAAVFFVFLYVDERAINGFEDRMHDAVAGLPPMARLVSNAQADMSVNALTHIVDRECVGRCYSYANYEPSSGQFRIRVTGPTSIVAATPLDSTRLEYGDSPVEERDLPLYRISVAADGSLAVDKMAAGVAVGVSQWNGLRWHR